MTDESQMRVSDVERDKVIEVLGEHAAVGRLTLSEHEERTEQALAARTRADLDRLTADLPGGTEEAAVVATSGSGRRRTPSRWFVAIMGGSRRRGRFRLSGSVNSVNIMGGDDIDLRDAEIDGEEVVINVFSLMGGATIYVPDSVEVVVEGFALMGGNDEHGSSRGPRPGAPVVRIRGYALMGGSDIWRLPPEAKGLSLRDARRVAREVERGDRGRGELGGGGAGASGGARQAGAIADEITARVSERVNRRMDRVYDRAELRDRMRSQRRELRDRHRRLRHGRSDDD